MKILNFIRKQPLWIKGLGVVTLLILLVIGVRVGRFALIGFSHYFSDSNQYIQQWLVQPDQRAALTTRRDQCEGAPFILPSEGFIGLLWDDPDAPYSLLNPHTGIDIFGDGREGTVPVYAVYDGTLTRLESWFATVIIEHDDPLNPGEKIWSYYTHMGAEDSTDSFVVADFPAGTTRKPVKQGTLLGYQGKFSGGVFPIALHVHLSLVRSDADGSFANESILANTLDPSPYFGLQLHQRDFPERPIRCDFVKK